MMKLNRYYISPRTLSLLVLVVLLGGVLYSDLRAVPEGIFRADLDRSFLITSRGPASIAPLTSEGVASWVEPDGISTIEWDCHKKDWRPLRNVAQIRLSGVCLRELRGVQNKNNGYTANIFATENGVYTTDYLGLDVGTNLLTFEWRDGASGNFSSNIKIVVEKQ